MNYAEHASVPPGDATGKGTLTEILVTKPDEELTDDELRERWKFQQPSSNLYMLVFMASIYGIASLFFQPLTGIIILVCAATATILIARWQQWRASTRTREQLLEDIKHLREVHSDMDM